MKLYGKRRRYSTFSLLLAANFSTRFPLFFFGAECDFFTSLQVILLFDTFVVFFRDSTATKLSLANHLNLFALVTSRRKVHGQFLFCSKFDVRVCYTDYFWANNCIRIRVFVSVKSRFSPFLFLSFVCWLTSIYASF